MQHKAPEREVLPPPDRSSDRPLADWVESVLLPLRNHDEDTQRRILLDAWRAMDHSQRFVWNKLISGAFRVGDSAQLVTRALAKLGKLEPGTVAHRLMGDWTPSAVPLNQGIPQAE